VVALCSATVRNRMKFAMPDRERLFEYLHFSVLYIEPALLHRLA
jgi:hypothetical protein